LSEVALLDRKLDGGAMMTTTQQPTERDRYWLNHEAAIKTSGQTAKAYAADRELSLQALYQARKRLRAMGLLDAARRRRSDCKAAARPVAFSKVELATPRASRPDFRLSLPNGLVLEWSGSELPTPVVELVERLTQPR
jgi:hypothetical protein